MSKRKPLTAEQKAKMNAQKRKKRALKTPEESVESRTIKSKRVVNARKQQKPEQTAKKIVKVAEQIANLRRKETENKTSIRKATGAQRKASVRASHSRMEDSNRAFKGKKMTLILNRVEKNVTQTLLQHGLTLSHDDLQTLCNFGKAAANSEKHAAQETDSNETNGPSTCPMVSFTIGESETPQLRKELLTQVGPLQKVVATSPSSLSQPPVVFQSTSVTAAATPKMIRSSNKRKCKNQFMEHLQLTKQVPAPATYGLSTVKKYNKIAPALKNSNVQANNVKSLTKTPLHSVSNGVNIPSATTPNTVVLKNLPNSQAKTRNVRVVSRVQIIRLSEGNLQKLQNNKSHIQYLSSKKELSPQETLLLPKLLQNQQIILATGTTVPTIPGQSVQGIPFLSGECMYVVQTNTKPVLPAIRQSPNELVTIRQSPKDLVTIRPSPKDLVTKVPNAETATTFKIENNSDSSLNLPTNNPDVTEILELVTNNGRDYILPDSERTTCNRHNCVIEVALLRSQLDQKTIALDSCNLELDNMKKELEKAKEYIGNLRAQLEENTQTLCSYLAANCS